MTPRPLERLGCCVPEVARRRPPVPEHHLLERDAHGVTGIAAQVLVREEEHALAPLEGPLEHLRRVGRGADHAAVLATERLQRSGGVHVGHWNDVVRAIEEFAQLAPRGGDIRRGGHVGHGAARLHVRQHHRLVVGGEDVGGLRHEVHAAEDDVRRFRPVGRVLRQRERVASVVRELDDVLALIVMAEDHDLVAEGGPRAADAPRQLLGIHRPVALRNLRLPRSERHLLRERYRVDAGVGFALQLRNQRLAALGNEGQGAGHSHLAGSRRE